MSRTVMDKLGWKPGRTGWCLDRPDTLADLLPLDTGPVAGTPDLLVAFVGGVDAVAPALAVMLPTYRRGAALWFAYPKLARRAPGDLTRDHGWAPLAEAGLLPVSQVAIDGRWSALRFRYRDEIARLTRRQDLPGRQAAA